MSVSDQIVLVSVTAQVSVRVSVSFQVSFRITVFTIVLVSIKC